MKLFCYAIYDSAARAYGRPWFQPNDGLAIRAFQALVNAKEETDVSLYPDQFTLFQIGEYDDTEGVIVPREPLNSLGNGLVFKSEDRVDPDGSELFRMVKEMYRMWKSA